MLESVTKGRKVCIDPSSGNSYYKRISNPVTAPPLFSITPSKGRLGASCNNSRLTLKLQEHGDATRKSYEIPDDMMYFSCKPLLTNVTDSAFWCRDDLSFSKSDIESVQLINQIDRKFLCCILSIEKQLILVLFDQHAVHERVRLEDLIADYRRCNVSRKEGCIPQSDLSSLQSAACHGAIKFGDKLDRSASISLLRSLTGCSMPFQCAHGRPSITPVLNISELRPSSQPYTADWNKLKLLRTRIGINSVYNGYVGHKLRK